MEKQLKARVFKAVISEWGEPVLFAPNKNGKLRFCIDYCKLNMGAVKDTFFLPGIDAYMDSPGSAKVFTAPDGDPRYQQMNIRKEYCPNTSFVCHAGSYQYKTMPFGLTNAPSTPERSIDTIFTPYRWNICLVYLEDVMIYWKTVKDHIRHVDEILTALKEERVKLNIKRCYFFQNTIDYFGQTTNLDKYEIDQANMALL